MKANTEKDTTTGKNHLLEYAQSSMQGWRTSMEDAHICQIDIVPDVHLFAVFDGHGGSEVARFCDKYFVENLVKNTKFIEKNYKDALIETFYHMDVLLE